MKRNLIASLLLASFAPAILSGGSEYQPTQTDIQTALGRAAKAWGIPAEIDSIEMTDKFRCYDETKPGGKRIYNPAYWAALSVFNDNKILINSWCKWTPELLQTAISHEYGHMIIRRSEHSEEKGSVMATSLPKHAKVTAKDVEFAKANLMERPTILIGGLD